MSEIETVEAPESTEDVGEQESTETSAEEVTSEPSVAADGEAVEAPRPTKRERHANRYAEMQRQAEETRRILEEERQARLQTEQRLAYFQGQLEAQQRYAQQPQKGETLEDKLEAIEAQMNEELVKASEGKTDMKRYYQLQRESIALMASEQAKTALEQYRKSQPDPKLIAAKETLEREFPWLETNEAARRAADGYISVLANGPKRRDPKAVATWREACAMAAKDFGLGGSPQAPTPTQKARYGGVSAKEGEGSTASDGDVPENEATMRVARAWGNEKMPHATDAQMFAAWKKRVGTARAK